MFRPDRPALRHESALRPDLVRHHSVDCAEAGLLSVFKSYARANVMMSHVSLCFSTAQFAESEFRPDQLVEFVFATTQFQSALWPDPLFCCTCPVSCL